MNIMARLKGISEWYYNPFRFIKRATALQKIFAVFFIILIVGVAQAMIELILAGAIVLLIFIVYAVVWVKQKLG